MSTEREREREREGLGTQYFEANGELRHSVFLRGELAVVALRVTEGVEGRIHEKQT